MADPYFRSLAGGIDPVAQLELIADLGFPGVFDLRLPVRPRDQQSRIGRAVERLGLIFGALSFAYGARDLPLLTDPDPEMAQVSTSNSKGELYASAKGRLVFGMAEARLQLGRVHTCRVA